jgi:hypothetical protein
MLKVENISSIEIHSEAWKMARLSKLTSSMIYTQLGEKPFTQGAMTYIYERVGEELSGIPAKYEIETDGTRWGHFHEPTATRRFGEFRNVEFLVVQKLIFAPNSRFSTTPDAIVPISKHGDCWEVETVEVKCFPSYGRFIECALCNTPQDVKKVDKAIFFQVLDQMDNCDALVGWLVFFHPDLKIGGFKVIRFRKMELIEEFKLLKERKAMALNKFEEIRQKLINLKN